MTASQLVFLGVALLVILAIVGLIFYAGKGTRGERMTPVAGLSFGLVLAGIVFSADLVVGYSLLGAGLAVALYDIYRRSRIT